MKLDLSALDGVSMDERTKSNLISQIVHQSAAEELQSLKEFSRYKQDCRKRALELSHNEAGRPIFQPTDNPLMNTQRVSPRVDIIELADKYYNWLINLPQ